MLATLLLWTSFMELCHMSELYDFTCLQQRRIAVILQAMLPASTDRIEATFKFFNWYLGHFYLCMMIFVHNDSQRMFGL